MKETKKFGILNLIALSLLVLILIAISTLPMLKIENDTDKLKHLESEASMQGVIDLWNVDSFSGGSISKSDYLEQVARKFEIQNKGLYINIQNMTVDEFSLAIASGKRPAMISFGYGLGELVKDLLAPLEIDLSAVKSEIKNAGMVENNQLAVGYLMGGYAYFSSSEKLSDASKDNSIKLSSEFVNCGYDKKLRKSVKHIYGLVYGKSNYISPQNCIENGLVSEICEAPSDYDAYVDFVSLNNATVLLGTQRDLVKLKGKLERGMVQDLLIEPVVNFNDLVQFIGAVKDQEEQVVNYSKFFMEFLLCDDSQKQLAGSGLFSTTISSLYPEDEFGLMEKAVWECKNIPNVF